MSWLTESDVSALKVGDEVGVSSGTRFDPPTIARITRRTPTQVIIGTSRFNKRGRSIGSSSWSAKYLLGMDDAKAQIAEHRERHGLILAQRALRDFRWGALDLARCQRVQALLAQFEQEATTAK